MIITVIEIPDNLTESRAIASPVWSQTEPSQGRIAGATAAHTHVTVWGELLYNGPTPPTVSPVWFDMQFWHNYQEPGSTVLRYVNSDYLPMCEIWKVHHFKIPGPAWATSGFGVAIPAFSLSDTMPSEFGFRLMARLETNP